MSIGIVYIHDAPDGKSYVGKTWRMNNRYGKGRLLSSHYQDTPFHRAVRRFGHENFETSEVCRIEVEDEIDGENVLAMLEIMAIEFFATMYPNGYNIREGGQYATFMNRKHSERTKLRMSRSRRKENLSEERREKMRQAQIGRLRDAHGHYVKTS